VASKNVDPGLVVIMVFTDIVSLVSFIGLIPVVFRKL